MRPRLFLAQAATATIVCIMLSCLATSKAFSTKSSRIVPGFAFVRRSHKAQQRHAIFRLSSGSTDQADEANKHQKAYHIQGTSASPAESTKQAEGRKRRQRSCGPGVHMTTNTHHTIATDVPKAMGGTNLAPQPVETLLAAWIGCTQATALFVGRQLGLTILKMDFNIHANRDERGALELPIEVTPTVPSRLQEIHGTIHVYTSSSDSVAEEQFHILQEQTEARCPVANMIIQSGCHMNVEWVVAPEEV
ncbi:osmC-like protein [Seminavis robusta]|uniref:OsmC-like protein n=1 Tax=Seminavis robusta TaxID=568900 RepID=A0A9N8F074_9STRA|nr:osmC-like protein [Seminavis robusta]|eukprot:Sro2887_g339420.1 osmC-like protein (249) ;mRNA; f:6965-7711